MSAFSLLAIEIVFMIVAYLLTNLTILALRNPERGAFLRKTLVSDLGAGACILATLIAQSFLGSGVFGAVTNIFVGLVVFAGLVLGLYFIISYLMGMDRRLAACDAGRSPFKPSLPPLGGTQPQG